MLWRLTGELDKFQYLSKQRAYTNIDDAMTPGFRLKIPMMIVLDTLRSDDPYLKRVGETWMRCSLKSYLRYNLHNDV